MLIGIYILLIVIVNIGFSHIPLIPFMGIMFPPMTLLVGFIFIARDYAQRRNGNAILPAMVVGVGLSYFMADPFVATASAVAFALSELIDYLTYTYFKMPFKERILASSAASTPIDSAIFLAMIGNFSLLACALMTASKMFSALLVYWISNKE